MKRLNLRALTALASVFLYACSAWLSAADGGLDTSFGSANTGIVDIDYPDSDNDAVFSLLQTAGGALLGTGTVESQGDFVLGGVQLTADGSLDATFGVGGFGKKVDREPINYNSGTAIVRSNGQIVVAVKQEDQYFGASVFSADFNTIASEDFTLNGGNGTYQITQTRLALDAADDSVLILACSGSGDIDIWRYEASPNQTGPESRSHITQTDAASCGKSPNVGLQSTRSIVAAFNSGSPGGRGGFTPDYGTLKVIRYNADGSQNGDFGSAGASTIGVPSLFTEIFIEAMAVQPDDSIVMAGEVRGGSGSSAFLVRLLANGNLDTSFGDQGFVIVSFPDANGIANVDFGLFDSVAVQSDGKIVAAGNYGSDQSQEYSFAMARVTASGVSDSSFGNNGIVQLSPTDGWDDQRTALVIQPSGKIVVGTASANNQSMRFARFLSSVDSDAEAPANGTDSATPVPALPLLGLGILASLLGFFGLRKLKQ